MIGVLLRALIGGLSALYRDLGLVPTQDFELFSGVPQILSLDST